MTFLHVMFQLKQKNIQYHEIYFIILLLITINSLKQLIITSIFT